MTLIKRNWPIVLLIILIFLIFSRILFYNKLFPGSDPLLVFYPYSFYFLHSQSFWNSGILSGFNAGATASDFSGNWIYYFLASKIGIIFLDYISFYNVIIFFYFILTAVFSYLAARKLDFDKYVSVLIASVYIFSAYNLSWMVNVVTAPSLFIFPAIIYFLLKFSPFEESPEGKKNTRNWLWLMLGGGFLGLGLTTSHPQFALLGIFGGFLFSIYLTFKNGIKLIKWKFFIAFLAICLIGSALSSYQLIPEYKTSLQSQRGSALSFNDSQECAIGISDFVRYVIPNFNFIVSCESLLYVGILPLILAILAIIYWKFIKKDILFWIFFLSFAILFSIKYSPLAWFFHQLPIWNSLRGPARFLMLGNFALAVLTGHGFNWVLGNKDNFKEFKIFYWLKLIFYGFLALILAVNFLGLFKNIFIKWAKNYFDKYYYAKTIGLPIENYHRSIENLISGNFYTFSFLNKDFAIPFILATAAFLIIIFIHKFNKNSLFFSILLIGFVWAVSSPMVSSGLTRDFFNETPIIEFLKSQSKPFRIYSLLPNLATYQLVALSREDAAEADQNEFFKTMLPSNLNLIYGLDSIDGYDVSMPRRTARLLAELLSERATMGNKIAEARLKPDEKIKIFESRKNILSMMNVKYVISAYPLNERIFKKVFEAKATRFEIPIYVYENKDVLPRFYFAKAVESVSSDEVGALEKILMPDTDFREKTFIECGDNCGNIFGGEIMDFEYRSGYLRLNTQNSIGGWLIFNESFDKNWQAEINGNAISIYRANYIYQAIKVPAGKNIVKFRYAIPIY